MVACFFSVIELIQTHVRVIKDLVFAHFDENDDGKVKFKKMIGEMGKKKCLRIRFRVMHILFIHFL